MRRFTILGLLALLLSATGFAQSDGNTADAEAAYTKTINARAQKIVAALALKDSVKGKKVEAMIAGQYRNLNAIQTDRDTQLKAAKAGGGSKEEAETAAKKIQDEATAKTDALHAAFLKELSSQLTAEQIVQVKDGLTYSVLPITYKGYLDMIPALKPAEKDQIMTWLVEAREHAMDAESSDKKHWWFGKYKGRINNYLAAQGYDLQKERKEWGERTKTASQNKAAGN